MVNKPLTIAFVHKEHKVENVDMLFKIEGFFFPFLFVAAPEASGSSWAVG